MSTGGLPEVDSKKPLEAGATIVPASKRRGGRVGQNATYIARIRVTPRPTAWANSPTCGSPPLVSVRASKTISNRWLSEVSSATRCDATAVTRPSSATVSCAGLMLSPTSADEAPTSADEALRGVLAVAIAYCWY
jgi:hypothetical protein